MSCSLSIKKRKRSSGVMESVSKTVGTLRETLPSTMTKNWVPISPYNGVI